MLERGVQASFDGNNIEIAPEDDGKEPVSAPILRRTPDPRGTRGVCGGGGRGSNEVKAVVDGSDIGTPTWDCILVCTLFSAVVVLASSFSVTPEYERGRCRSWRREM